MFGPALRGIYATRTGGVTSWDVYALHYEDTIARYVQGLAHERRWSLGSRVFGGQKAWDWNWELAVQGGRFGDAEIRAWSQPGADPAARASRSAERQPRLLLASQSP